MLATITAQSDGLMSVDLKALREANQIVFRRRRDGSAVIECIKELDRIHDIPVHAEIRNAPHNAEAFCMLQDCRYNEEWQTIASLLRVGDQLELVEFRADSHTNGYCEEADLHADSLRLHVRRGEKRMVFLLAVEVCADNLARMIQR